MPQTSHKAQIVIATNNAGKRDEMRALLAETSELQGFVLITMREAGFPDWEPKETGDDFAANALIKARDAAFVTGMSALADDSGLCVDALDSAPGLQSARWLGPHISDNEKNEAILARLESTAPDERGARFICALALAMSCGASEVREGACYGRIALRSQGSEGFGYDPIFIPDGESRTLAQMNGAEKNAISHRRNAWTALSPVALQLLENNP